MRTVLWRRAAVFVALILALTGARETDAQLAAPNDQQPNQTQGVHRSLQDKTPAPRKNLTWQSISQNAFKAGNVVQPTERKLSREKYAADCARTLGIIPNFHCVNATGNIIPIEVPTGDSHPCPSLGACVPGSRFLNLTQELTKAPTDVIALALCRKYYSNTTGFHDINIVQYNRSTGEACFFNSPLRNDDVSWDGLAPNVPSPTAGLNQNGAIAQSMQAKKAARYWAPPANTQPGAVGLHPAGTVACTNCHDTDPFIWSPWLKQVLPQSEIESFSSALSPYNVDWNGLFAPFDSRLIVIDNVSCGGVCHRFAHGSMNVISREGIGKYMPPREDGAAAISEKKLKDYLSTVDACLDPNVAAKHKKTCGDPPKYYPAGHIPR